MTKSVISHLRKAEFKIHQNQPNHAGMATGRLMNVLAHTIREFIFVCDRPFSDNRGSVLRCKQNVWLTIGRRTKLNALFWIELHSFGLDIPDAPC